MHLHTFTMKLQTLTHTDRVRALCRLCLDYFYHRSQFVYNRANVSLSPSFIDYETAKNQPSCLVRILFSALCSAIYRKKDPFEKVAAKRT